MLICGFLLQRNMIGRFKNPIKLYYMTMRFQKPNVMEIGVQSGKEKCKIPNDKREA